MGAYYARQMLQARKDGRIGVVPYLTGFEVYTWWDLGVDDSMSIWFIQAVGEQVRVIDYYESSGMSLSHYAKVLKDKPYVYGDHFWPHDGAVREMSSTGDYAMSRKDTAEQLGVRPVTVIHRPKDTMSVLSGIENVRNLLGRCWFDEIKCNVGISCLEGYRAKYDEDKKKLLDHPEHDYCSHGADAFRTGAVGFQKMFKGNVQTEASSYDPLTGLDFAAMAARQGTALQDYDPLR
jgi:phage terminase large subunit